VCKPANTEFDHGETVCRQCTASGKQETTSLSDFFDAREDLVDCHVDSHPSTTSQPHMKPGPVETKKKHVQQRQPESVQQQRQPESVQQQRQPEPVQQQRVGHERGPEETRQQQQQSPTNTLLTLELKVSHAALCTALSKRGEEDTLVILRVTKRQLLDSIADGGAQKALSEVLTQVNDIAQKKAKKQKVGEGEDCKGVKGEGEGEVVNLRGVPVACGTHVRFQD
jgi:hypothetical protein